MRSFLHHIDPLSPWSLTALAVGILRIALGISSVVAPSLTCSVF